MDRVTTRDQIRKILDLLNVKNIPKLGRPNISMLYNFLLSAMAQNEDDALLIAVETVVSVLQQSLHNFTYSTEDWSIMARGFASFSHCIINMVALDPLFLNPKHSTLTGNAIELFLSAINKCAYLQCLVLEMDGANLLKIMCKEEIMFSIREVVLKNFKLLIKGCSLPSRKQFITKNRSLLQNFATILPKLGDYVLQEIFFETLLRISMATGEWKATLRSWFSNYKLDVDALNPRQFEITSRLFLNQINSTIPPPERVFSLACLQITAVDGEMLLKPEGYEDLWVDCSPRTGDIHVLCDGGSGSWVRLILKHMRVKSIDCEAGIFSRAQGILESVEVEIQLASVVVIPLQHREIHCSSLAMVFPINPKFFEAEKYFFKHCYSSIYKGFQRVPLNLVRDLPTSSCGFHPLAVKKASPPRSPSVSSISKTSSFHQWTTSSASLVDESSKKLISSTPKFMDELPNVVLKKTHFGNFDTTLVKGKTAEAIATNKRTLYTPGKDEWADLPSIPLFNAPRQISNKYFPVGRRSKASKRHASTNDKLKKKGKFEQICANEAVNNRLDILRSGKEEVNVHVDYENFYVSPMLDVVNVSVDHPPPSLDSVAPTLHPVSPPPSVPLIVKHDSNPDVISSQKKVQGKRVRKPRQPSKGGPQSTQISPGSTFQPNDGQKMVAQGNAKTLIDEVTKTDILAGLTSVREEFTNCINNHKSKLGKMREELGIIEKGVSTLQHFCSETVTNVDTMGSSMAIISGHMTDLITALHNSDPRHIRRELRSLQIALTKSRLPLS